MGLLPDDEIRNPGAGEPWLKSERDKALDEYFEGAHPKQLGIKYKRVPKAFLNSILNKLRYNFKKEGFEDQPGRAERYEVYQRVSRKGKRFTPNEIDFIRCHKELGLDVHITATILQRSVSELDQSWKEPGKVKEKKIFAPTLDLILAHRYIYHVYETPVISDKTYDDLVKEEKEYGGGEKALAAPVRPCPERIKTLALYLCQRHKDEQEAE